MWFVYALIYFFCLALVNYIDEYLTANNKLPKNTNIHTKIGGLILISTLLTVSGAFMIWVFNKNLALPKESLHLALLSAIPMVYTWASYFYLLTLFPVFQVVPLFQLTSLWLLLMELANGEVLTTSGLVGIILLTFGAYVLDAGAIRWQVPTRLLLLMIPATVAFASMNFMVRLASAQGSGIAVSFWQLVAIGCIGIMLFLSVKRYRDGFLFRIQKQGRNFLGFSIINESLSQTGVVFNNLAVIAAPLATYVTATSGIQSIILLVLFLLFPQHQKTKVSGLQIISIVVICLGVFLIER